MKKNLKTKEMASVAEFLNECTVVTLEKYTCKDVYEVYKAWCKDNAFYLVEKTEFNECLKLLNKSNIVTLSDGTTYYDNIKLNEYVKKEYANILPEICDIKNNNNVVVYIQSSKDELDDEFLGEQISNIYNYCLDKKYDIMYTYYDIGDYEDYYQYRSLIDDIYMGMVDKVIVLKPDRIYNGFYNGISELIEALELNNVELEFVDNYIEIPDRNYELLNEYINKKTDKKGYEMNNIKKIVNDVNENEVANSNYREKVLLYLGVRQEDANILGIIDDQIFGLILECQNQNYDVMGVYSDFGKFTNIKGYEDMLMDLNLDIVDKILVSNPDVLENIPNDVLKELKEVTRIECLDDYNFAKELDKEFGALLKV